ncbi:hypothetical protein LJC17_02750 [Acholeplasma sp. OttesenSCG-928-E16]|nr:hypothetical protein [Acholeplasma sp. OttesenSCG-928-E16]
MKKFDSYLDDYGIITVIIDKSLIANNDEFYLKTPHQKERLKIIQKIDYQESIKFILEYQMDLLLVDNNYLFYHNHKSLIKSGKIVRTKRFDEEFKYEKLDLGVTYSKENTIVKVWSPVIKDLELVYFKSPKKKEKKKFTYNQKGVWEVKLDGDYDNYLYYLNVKRNKVFKKVLDPYAIASTANGKYNAIINLDSMYQVKNERPHFSGNILDSVIYEAHIRDLSSLTNNENKGEFLGLLNGNKPLDYIRSLGVTHVQFLPINDYEEVNELNKKAYNWGYNPSQYLALEGSYSSNPKDPKTRINEFKRVIDYMHGIGLLVVIDVVYNHVYLEKTFPFNSLVPGYYYRYDQNGIKTISSGLDNDVATEKNMTKHLILQATKHFLEFYHVDGFRFDLMGLLDIKTINEVYKLSKSINNKAILYGEGWNMECPLKKDLRANMSNQDKMEVAHFNDHFREGFHNVIKSLQGDFSEFLMGTPSLFDSPKKSINYLSCHDGLTLFDRISSNGSSVFIADAIKLSFAFIILSQGVPFIQGGDEFLRTKKYNENSYNSGDLINGFDYSLLSESKGTIKYLKELIRLRKEHDCFRMDSNDAIKNQIKEISKNFFSLQKDDKIYYVYFKMKEKEETINFDNEVVEIFDGYQNTENINKSFLIKHVGVYVYKGANNG